MNKKYIYIISAAVILAFAGNFYFSDKNIKIKETANTETTTGFLQEITEVRVHEGANRTGAEIYEFRCKGCHAKNTQGAPMPDDKFEWSRRLSQGFDVLLERSMEGYNNYLMPPKGGCRDCNKQEVKDAIIYMLEMSGIKLSKELTQIE